MPLPLPRGETITVLNPGQPTRDSAGNYIPGAAIPASIEGCAVWATTGTEADNAQDQVAERLTVLAPYGVAITATSRVEVRGHVFEVVGAPLPWASPLSGTEAGVELHLERVTG